MEVKKCPYCTEEIQEKAIVCRYCGRDLAPQEVARVSMDLSREKPRKAGASEADVSPKQANGYLPPRKSAWLRAIAFGGLLAALASIPRLLAILDTSQKIAEGLLDELALRTSLQDLIFGFIANLLVWSLVTAMVIAIWRRSRSLAVALVVLVVSLGIVFVFADDITSLLGPTPSLGETVSGSLSEPSGAASATSTRSTQVTPRETKSPEQVMTNEARATMGAELLQEAIEVRQGTLEACEADPNCTLAPVPVPFLRVGTDDATDQ